MRDRNGASVMIGVEAKMQRDSTRILSTAVTEQSATGDSGDEHALAFEAYDYVMRHVDPGLLPDEDSAAQRGSLARALDAFTRTEESVALTQAAMFMATGVWPLVHMTSFEAVTGPKADRWLVKTVGLLVTVVGGAIGSAALRRRITPETRLLAISSSLGLAAIDVVYARKRRISRVYLLDAIAEAGLIVSWLTAASRQPGQLATTARDERSTATMGA